MSTTASDATALGWAHGFGDPPDPQRNIRLRIARAIRKARENRELSRADAARISGVAERQIEAWELGERSIFAADLAEYLNALGVLHLHGDGRPRENLTHEGEVLPLPSLDDYDNSR